MVWTLKTPVDAAQMLMRQTLLLKIFKKYIYHSDILGTFKTLPLAKRTNSNGPRKLL